ncbi:hypothetical protein Tco_0664943 [Tanacetum coccineum]
MVTTGLVAHTAGQVTDLQGQDDDIAGKGYYRTGTAGPAGGALTWWNTHVMTVTHDVAYSMTWVNLKKKMTDKMLPEEGIKIERVDGGQESAVPWRKDKLKTMRKSEKHLPKQSESTQRQTKGQNNGRAYLWKV